MKYVYLALIISIIACRPNAKQGNNTVDVTGIKKSGDTSLPTSASDLAEIMDIFKDTNKYSTEDILRNPDKKLFKISPDAYNFSFLAPYKKRMNIFVKSIHDTSGVCLTLDSIDNIHDYFWKSNDEIIFTKDSLGDENDHLYLMNIRTKAIKAITPFSNVRAVVYNEMQYDSEHIFISLNLDNVETERPYRLNIHDGSLEKLNIPNVIPNVYLLDHLGKFRVFTATQGCDQVIYYRQTENDSFRNILQTDCYSTFAVYFFNATNDKLIALSDLGRDKQVLVEFDPLTKKETILFGHPKVDLDKPFYSDHLKRLSYLSYKVDRIENEAFAPSYKMIFQQLEKKFPKHNFELMSTDEKEEHFLFSVSSDVMCEHYYLYDVKTKEFSLMAKMYPWLDSTDFSHQESVTYKSRDGIDIPGYIIFPKNVNRKNLPFIIVPHGGPWSRVYWKFNVYLQNYTQAGYALMVMNFRGSTGYGKNFVNISKKEWGGKIQEDIADATHWIIQQGYADPKRIAILGGSFGGYSVLCGLTQNPDLYCCGVDIFGVSNMFTFLKTYPPYWKPWEAYFNDMIGNIHDPNDSLLLATQSPALHTDKIIKPLLVIQGANDARVKIDESDQIVRSLRNRGVDVPYMVKYNEGHGFQFEENKIEQQKVIMGFLAKYIKGVKG